MWPGPSSSPRRSVSAQTSQPPDSAGRQATSARPAKARLQVVLGAGAAVPDRDPMSPPELAADAPVALLAQPVEIALGVALGVDLDPARRSRRPSPAGRSRRCRPASSPMRTNHWSERYGSIGVLLRSEWLSRTRYESTRSSRPERLQVLDDPLAHHAAGRGRRTCRRSRCRCRRG